MGAAPPPEGVTPNFVNPDSTGYQLIIVAVVFPVLALCFLIPRLYTASCIIKKWHADDYLIVVGFLFAVSNSTICITQAHMGMGKHMWDIPFPDFQKVMKLGMIGGAFTYNITTLFIKVSILSFFLRFSLVDHKFRFAVYVVIFLAVGYTIPNAFLFLYICRPMEYYWDWLLPGGGTCINQQAAFDSANILNMATDFLILLLPIWMLRPIRASLFKKIGICLILMTGGFVCAVSTMRMVTAFTGASNQDISRHYVTNLIWCIVEQDVGLICACLPSLRAFTKRFFPNLFIFSPAFEERLTSTIGPFSISLRPRQRQDPALDDESALAVPDEGAGQRSWWQKKAQEENEENAQSKGLDDLEHVEVKVKSADGEEDLEKGKETRYKRRTVKA
ncbi:hypothetical protein QBC35DRAFT_386072 [Podospora australis]|uniref:Rhodopsin domain-containing protein n=1 Tax=Podospora australis TaxID=1536484 RepID=A0AAN6WV02_9PEZI|nr:hypothetical protein QBC35DRAFT_386072 [Podospora australis]